MKASELKIGYSYQRKDDYMSISKNTPVIVSSETNVVFTKEMLIDVLLNNKHIFVGIPLTEEYISKFGFEISNKKTWLKTSGVYPGQIDVELTKDFCLTFFGSKIKYVHQLQNLYFALTGEELEFI